MVGREVACHEAREDARDEAHQPAKRPLRDELDASGVAGLAQHPRAVDWIRALDEVDVESAGPVEFGELDDLNELPGPGRLGPHPHPVSMPGARPR